MRPMFIALLSFSFQTAASAATCAEFALEASAWLSGRSDHVVRTRMTATVAGRVYDGFTFADFVPATNAGVFSLPAALKKDAVTLRHIGGAHPDLNVGFRFALTDVPPLSVRNLATGLRLDSTTLPTCESLPALGIWRLKSATTGTGNQYIFEMKFDTVPR